MTQNTDEKELRWVGSSYDDLLVFPKAARREAGFQLSKVQAGLEATDWKPFDVVGSGTREIRLRDTSKQDIEITTVRYRAVVTARKAKR